MKLYFRLLWLWLTRSFKTPCPVFGPCYTSFRVLPTDLDVLRHVNNGVYLTLMDLGRVDLMHRGGIYETVKKEQWYPIVSAETIRFRKSLKLGQKFTIRSEVLGWDEKSVYLSQRFIRNEETIAEAALKARFLRRSGGSVRSAELLSKLNVEGEAPELPAWLVSWDLSVEAMTDATQEE